MILALAVAALVIPPTQQPVEHPWRACAHEDSTRCVWDARHQGNGEGRSLLARKDGRITYIPHSAAHQLVHGTTRRPWGPCTDEDSVRCVWDRDLLNVAGIRANVLITVTGRAVHLPHTATHQLLYGGN